MIRENRIKNIHPWMKCRAILLQNKNRNKKCFYHFSSWVSFKRFVCKSDIVAWFCCPMQFGLAENVLVLFAIKKVFEILFHDSSQNFKHRNSRIFVLPVEMAVYYRSCPNHTGLQNQTMISESAMLGHIFSSTFNCRVFKISPARIIRHWGLWCCRKS